MSVMFNKKELPDFIRVTGINFPVLPEVEFKEIAVPRRYGNIDTGVTFGGKPISLTIMLIRDKVKNIHEQADELKIWLKGDNLKPSQLTFDEQPTKYILARVINNVEIDDLFIQGTATIELYAANPIKYDIADYSVASENGAINIPYDAMEKAPAFITVVPYSACSNIVILHEQSGYAIKLIGSFKASQIISVDCNKKVVTVDGVVSMRVLDFTSRWIYLTNGLNTISLTNQGTRIDYWLQAKYKKAN